MNLLYLYTHFSSIGRTKLMYWWYKYWVKTWWLIKVLVLYIYKCANDIDDVDNIMGIDYIFSTSSLTIDYIFTYSILFIDYVLWWVEFWVLIVYYDRFKSRYWLYKYYLSKSGGWHSFLYTYYLSPLCANRYQTTYRGGVLNR